MIELSSSLMTPENVSRPEKSLPLQLYDSMIELSSSSMTPEKV
jgi:hypothetical protein